MEAISLKLDSTFLERIEQVMRKHHYTTKTEFIREAIRDKISALEKARMLAALDRVAGSSKHRTTDAQLHAAREKAFEELERRFKK